MAVAVEVTVERSPHETFALWAAIERSPEYSDMVIERTKLTEGPTGVGTMYRAVDQWPGRRVTYSIEITDYEPGARLAARWSEPLNGQSEAEFSSVAGGGTRLAWKAETHPSGVMGLLSPLMNFWAVRQSKLYLRSFKQWVEGQ